MILQSRDRDFVERRTDARGGYEFQGVDPGSVTLQVLYGKANVSSKIAYTGAETVKNFPIDPGTRLGCVLYIEYRRGSLFSTTYAEAQLLRQPKITRDP